MPWVVQSFWTLCDPMDCSPPGFCVHAILQARALQWVAIPFSRASSWPRDRTQVSCTGRQILYSLSHQGGNKPEELTQIYTRALEFFLSIIYFLITIINFWDSLRLSLDECYREYVKKHLKTYLTFKLIFLNNLKIFLSPQTTLLFRKESLKFLGQYYIK